MKREYLFLMLFALLGYTGGATTQQWLAADGTRAAPSYAFSAESGLGVYRASSGRICTTGVDTADGSICFQNGQIQFGSGNVSGARLQFDQAPATTGFYFADSTTDTIGWHTDTGTGDALIGTYGTRFVTASSIGTTYMHSYNVSAGNITMGNSSGTTWTSAQGIGYTNYGVQLDVGGYMGVGTAGVTTDTGVRGAADGSMDYELDGAVVAYSRNKDLLEITGGDYSLIYYSANAKPNATDCDAAGEDGRIYHDYSNNRIYVCNATSTNNWMYVDLTE